MTYPALYMVIAGERIGVGHRRQHSVVNPATGVEIGQLPLADAADLDRALAVAAEGFALWRDAPPSHRAAVLAGAAGLLIQRQEEIARILTTEEGKTLPEARGEVMMVAELFSFYAGEVQRIYGRTLVRPTGQRATVSYEPVGPVAAFAPWNFPASNVGRKLGAPIAAGCSVIVKPAEETPATALAILQALLDAGLPPAVAQVVFGVPDEVSRHLLASPVIRKLSFTGSTVVGKHLARLAVDNCLRTTMELGGHGPVLVFADADIERALDQVVRAKYRNAGQVCVSPTRFIVEESVFERFREGFVARARAIVVGDGMDPASQMGPLAHARRPEAISTLVNDAVAAGARLDWGGKRIGNQGFFFEPTVLSDIPLNARIMNEEPFGPVALLNAYAGEAEMIAEANRLPFGLAAYAWSENTQRQRRLARALEAGMVGINTPQIGGADSPFGGVKWSGHGAEDGPEGLHACLVTKAVHES
jgi:succinate-semialdehyde dehydrogenase/glutarate-semialdehyde dehydrogenase